MNTTEYIPRHIEPLVRKAINERKVVLITGARKMGKTTFVQRIAREHGMKYLSLEVDDICVLAQNDPQDFIKSFGTRGGVIDEIDRLPQLMDVIRHQVEKDRYPGRFVVTAESGNLFSAPQLLDQLAQQVLTINLLPFSIGEIEGLDLPADFLSCALKDNFPSYEEWRGSGRVWHSAWRGGYPESVLDVSSGFGEWYVDYVQILVKRLVQENSVHLLARNVLPFLEYLSQYAGNLINMAKVGNYFGLSAQDTEKCIRFLEQLSIIKRLYNWDPYPTEQQKNHPKLYFVDTGILGSLIKLGGSDVVLADQIKGSLMENSVFTALFHAISLRPDEDIKLHFYRHLPKGESSDKEVDFVLICDSFVIGIEVKSSSKTKPRDFAGLEHLRERFTDRFVCGVVLYTGEVVRRTAKGFYEVPVSRLWGRSRGRFT